MAGERGEKGYYRGRKERGSGEERKEGQTGGGVLRGGGMRAVKAFGVFIRLPKPRAPLPIRLVDTASHVNEMQSGREKGRETPTSLCQFFAGARSLFLRRWLSLFLSVCRPRDVTPFHPPYPPHPHPKPTAIVAPPPPILPLSLGKIMICLFFLFFASPPL